MWQNTSGLAVTDAINPQGTHLALLELQRVLAPGGTLLFSMPVGRERVEFNAQRIWNPLRVPGVLNELEIIEFSTVNDRGEFLQFVDPQLYRFVRPK